MIHGVPKNSKFRKWGQDPGIIRASLLDGLGAEIRVLLLKGLKQPPWVGPGEVLGKCPGSSEVQGKSLEPPGGQSGAVKTAVKTAAKPAVKTL